MSTASSLKSIFPFLSELETLFFDLFDLKKLPLDKDKYDYFIKNDGSNELKSYDSNQDVLEFYIFFPDHMTKIVTLLDYIEISLLKTKFQKNLSFNFEGYKSSLNSSDKQIRYDLFKDVEETIVQEDGEKEFKFIIVMKKILNYVEHKYIQAIKFASNLFSKIFEDFLFTFKESKENSVTNIRQIVFLEIMRLRTLIQLTSNETKEIWKESLNMGQEITCLNDLLTPNSYILKNEYIPKIEDTISNMKKNQKSHILNFLTCDENEFSSLSSSSSSSSSNSNSTSTSTSNSNSNSNSKKSTYSDSPLSSKTMKSFSTSKLSIYDRRLSHEKDDIISAPGNKSSATDGSVKKSSSGSTGINPNLIKLIQEEQKSIKIKPIYLYNTIEINECLNQILFNWKTMEYNNEVEDFLDNIINRIAYIINYGSNSTTEKTNIDVENRILENIKRNKIEFVDGIHQSLFNYEAKYYDIAEKLYRFKTREIYCLNQERNTQNNPIKSLFKIWKNSEKITLFTYTYEIGEFYKRFCISLKNATIKWLDGTSGQEFKEPFKKQLLMAAIANSSNHVFQYLYPQLTNTYQNIMEKIHKNMTMIVVGRSNMDVKLLFEDMELISDGTKRIKEKLIKIHDNIVLQIFDSIISPPETDSTYQTYSFKLNYVVNEQLEDFIIAQIDRKDPFLGYLFSRIRFHIQKNNEIVGFFKKLVDEGVCFLQRSSECKNITPNSYIAINTSSIYESIALILIYLKITKPHDCIVAHYFSKINQHLF